MVLSCIANVKRGEDKKRPVVPPHVVYASYCGDRSGSMCQQMEASAKGLYDWVKDISSGIIQNNQEGYMNVVHFDDSVQVNMDYVPMKDVRLSMENARKWSEPRGSTRLYDTAIQEINKLRNKIKEIKKSKPDLNVHGIFQLFSDGYDNMSVASVEHMKNAIQKAREEGISCYYLGIGQDAVEIGQDYGFSANESLTVDIGNKTSGFAFRSCSANMLRAASTGTTPSFSQAMRQNSAPSQQYDTPSTVPVGNNFTLRQPPRPSMLNLRQAAIVQDEEPSLFLA